MAVKSKPRNNKTNKDVTIATLKKENKYLRSILVEKDGCIDFTYKADYIELCNDVECMKEELEEIYGEKSASELIELLDGYSLKDQEWMLAAMLKDE